jgi:Domain of unknown function (DUF1992)
VEPETDQTHSTEENPFETKAQRLRRAAEESISQAMRSAEATGELRHLYGKPLDLGDDSPDWLVTKVLKQQGFTHPLLERARDLEEPKRKADAIVERMRERRDRLTRPGTQYTAEQAEAFNTWRSFALAEYRDALAALNRAIHDYNLAIPPALHKRPYRIEKTLATAEDEIPPVSIPQPPPPARSRLRTILGSLWNRLGGKTSNS